MWAGVRAGAVFEDWVKVSGSEVELNLGLRLGLGLGVRSGLGLGVEAGAGG